MTEAVIKSKYLNESMTLKLYKPETFSPLYKYNVCIMQDGDDYYQMGRIATLSDELHQANEITDTIFVGIHYQDRADRREKYHPDGKQQKAYIHFLAHEVVPYLDAELPTYHMGLSRALLGDSLGGTLALMASLTYPHTFGKIMIQSPYIDETVLHKVKDFNRFHLIDIYHSIGTNEKNVLTTDQLEINFTASNHELNQILQNKNCSYLYDEIGNGDHTWKYWQPDLVNALKFNFSQ